MHVGINTPRSLVKPTCTTLHMIQAVKGCFSSALLAALVYSSVKKSTAGEHWHQMQSGASVPQLTIHYRHLHVHACATNSSSKYIQHTYTYIMRCRYTSQQTAVVAAPWLCTAVLLLLRSARRSALFVHDTMSFDVM